MGTNLDLVNSEITLSSGWMDLSPQWQYKSIRIGNPSVTKRGSLANGVTQGFSPDSSAPACGRQAEGLSYMSGQQLGFCN